jgi:hypothetical protein
MSVILVFLRSGIGSSEDIKSYGASAWINAKWVMFQLHHCEHKLHSMRYGVRFVLDQLALLDIYNANALKQHSADRYIDVCVKFVSASAPFTHA